MRLVIKITPFRPGIESGQHTQYRPATARRSSQFFTRTAILSGSSHVSRTTTPQLNLANTSPGIAAKLVYIRPRERTCYQEIHVRRFARTGYTKRLKESERKCRRGVGPAGLRILSRCIH